MIWTICCIVQHWYIDIYIYKTISIYKNIFSWKMVGTLFPSSSIFRPMNICFLTKMHQEILDICSHNQRRKIDGHTGNTVILTSHFRSRNTWCEQFSKCWEECHVWTFRRIFWWSVTPSSLLKIHLLMLYKWKYMGIYKWKGDWFQSVLITVHYLYEDNQNILFCNILSLQRKLILCFKYQRVGNRLPLQPLADQLTRSSANVCDTAWNCLRNLLFKNILFARFL